MFSYYPRPTDWRQPVGRALYYGTKFIRIESDSLKKFLVSYYPRPTDWRQPVGRALYYGTKFIRIESDSLKKFLVSYYPRPTDWRQPVGRALYYGTKYFKKNCFLSSVIDHRSSTIAHRLYLINPLALIVKIFTAIASKITPKNLRIASIPPGPRVLSMLFSNFRTMNTNTRLMRMAINTVDSG